MREGSKVAIAGGGVAGLATALAFRKAGYEVIVIERTAVLDTVGAGILLQANGLLVLDALGLGDEVRAAGAAMARFQLRNRYGRTLVAIEPQAHLPRALSPLCIHRADLHAILWGACAAAGVTLHLGCKTVAIEHGQRSAFVCETASGSVDIAGDLLVGADGINSVVRSAAGVPAHFWPVIEGSVQGVASHAVPADCHGEYLGGALACGMLPMSKDKTFWFWGGSGTAMEGIGQQHFVDWKRSVCRDFPAMERVLAGRHEWPGTVQLLHRSVRCDRWSTGNVVLVGDAAHAMSPNLGQGANCALVDALALVCHVGRRDLRSGLGEALLRFEHDRRPVVDEMQLRGHREGAAAITSWPGKEAITNFVLRLARFASPARQRADVLLMSGLAPGDPDLAAAGVSSPLPW